MSESKRFEILNVRTPTFIDTSTGIFPLYNLTIKELNDYLEKFVEKVISEHTRLNDMKNQVKNK